MNPQLGRLFVAVVCYLTVASATRAQDDRFGPEPERPSHRPIDSGVGDLSQAESLLAQRLRRNHKLDDLHDLLKPFHDHPELMKQFKGMKPEDLRKLEEVVKNNPSLLDDPKLGDLLNQVGKVEHGQTLDDDKRKELANLAKDFLGKHNKETPTVLNPVNSGTGAPSDPAPPVVAGPPPSPAPVASASGWLNHDLLSGMANVVKDIDHSPEGQALRDDFLRELANGDARRSDPGTGFADFFKGFVSSQQAGWLARNLKPPPMPDLGGWSVGPAASAVPSVGGPDGTLDAVVWVVVLALIGAAVWMAYGAARRQAAAARARDWTPGPWPVRPSQMSTREDLIRAFEHLAYLCLGRVARTLNHLDVAARLGQTGADRAEAAGRLAHLYEQARYAPPDEALPPDELTAARGDLTALAGAAA